jgi:hypothetical protein
MMFQFRKEKLLGKDDGSSCCFQPVSRHPLVFKSPKACMVFKVTKPTARKWQSSLHAG